jgi:hypothetical protein
MLADSEVSDRQKAALEGGQQIAGAAANLYSPFGSQESGIPQLGATRQRTLQRESISGRPLGSRVIEFPQAGPRSRSGVSWLFDSLLELESLKQTSGDAPVPKPQTLTMAEHIIRMCDTEGLGAPLIDVRDNGGVEIFCREDNRGLLIVLNPNNTLQVFGDFSGEAWRSRYDLSGAVWETHLSAFLRELRPIQATKLRA